MQRWNGQASTCRSDMVASLGLLQALSGDLRLVQIRKQAAPSELIPRYVYEEPS